MAGSAPDSAEAIGIAVDPAIVLMNQSVRKESRLSRCFRFPVNAPMVGIERFR